MAGYRAIATKYGLRAHIDDDLGVFEWKRRMGVHLAFHRNPVNIALHTVFPVVNGFAVLLILYPWTIPGVTILSQPLNLALIFLALSFVLFAVLDVLAAVLVTGVVAATYPLCSWAMEQLDGSALWMAIVGAVLFVFALAVQVLIGHNIAERGIDDSTDNFKELFETKNPIYFTVLPVYTILDLLFMLGYRPGLARFIWDITDELRPKVEAHNLERER